MCLPAPARNIEIVFPDFLLNFNQQFSGKLVPSIEEQMLLAIDLATKNVKSKSGGPFASLIVEIETNRILCAAVNLVVEQSQSWLHGERLAFALGQKTIDNFSFPKGKFRLVSSAQMCIGCWAESLSSGISEIVVAATAEDVETHTPFKEGLLPGDWLEQLSNQGIKHTSNVCREESLEPLRLYGKSGEAYYDAGSRKEN